MLLGFKKRFAPLIKIGSKVHTMRRKPKRMPKVGETLYMYTGLRTKHTEFITDKEKLHGHQRVRVIITRAVAMKRGRFPFPVYTLRLWVDGRELVGVELTDFVQWDGFKDENDFCEFWFIGLKKTVKKVGGSFVLFHWTDLRY